MEVVEKLADLERLSHYREANEWAYNLWPSRDALAWFMRHHRDELQAVGALHKIRSDWFVSKSVFPGAVAQIIGLATAEAEAA